MMIADCATAANPVACVVKSVRSTNTLCVDKVDRWNVMAANTCGDCEDWALTIGENLIAYGGYQPEDLQILITRTWKGDCHAVLQAKDKIIDNGTVRGSNPHTVVGSLSWNEAVSYVGKRGATCGMYETVR